VLGFGLGVLCVFWVFEAWVRQDRKEIFRSFFTTSQRCNRQGSFPLGFFIFEAECFYLLMFLFFNKIVLLQVEPYIRVTFIELNFSHEL
jgi:hypothetical protein